MASTGKAGSIEMALQGHGNIHGSGFKNGVPCCIQAGTAVHVDNYFDYLWVHRTPLPMGLHCQSPLVMGARSLGGPRAPSIGAVPSVLPDDPLHTAETTNSMVPQKNPNVLAFFSSCETHDSLPIP